MSGLIKAEQLSADVRSLSLAAANQDDAPFDPSLVDREKVLEDRLVLLEAELAELRASLPDKLAAERDNGRKSGLKERDESAAKKLALVEAAVAQAVEMWARRLQSLDGLAVEISRCILARMIGNSEWQADLIRQAIADRVVRLDQESAFRVRVSSADFPDGTDLPTSGTNFVIEVSDGLPSGECIIDLAMGHHDLGPQAQWSNVAAELDSLAEEAARPC